MSAAWLWAWVAGVALVSSLQDLPPALVWAGLAAAALVTAAWAWSCRGSRTAQALVCLAAFVAGLAWAGWRAELRLADRLPVSDEARDLRVVGVITGLPDRSELAWRFRFEIESVAGLAPDWAPGSVWLAWYDAPVEPRPGERWEWTIRLKRPHGSLNPGGFDFEAWMLERDLIATGYVRPDPPPRRLAEFVPSIGNAIELARDRLRASLLVRSQGLRWGGVLCALVLGDQRAIGNADWSLFNRTGISHLVAISGLHITMLAGLVAALTAGLWRRSRHLLSRAPAQSAAALAAVASAGAYALLAGWAVPAQRTFFMLAVVALAFVLRARPSAMTSLAAAAAVVCALDPWAISAPGFWLSFGAVAAIFWVESGRRREAAGNALARLRLALATGVRVQVAVSLVLTPLTAWLFHQVSLVSPLANALAIPLVSWVVTPLALLAAASLALPGPLANVSGLLLWAANSIFAALVQWLEWLAAWPWASVATATPPWPLLVLALAGAAWLLAPAGWPWRWAGATWMASMFLWPAPRPVAGQWWVSAVDIGQGAAVLIEAPGAVWLYDAGPRHGRDSDAGERILLPLLRAKGITRLDGLIVSHLDSDHSGGAASILRALPVDRVLSSIPAGSEALAGRSEVDACKAGQTWRAGGLEFEMLHPLPEHYAQRRSTNALSCVLRVSGPGARLLLSGDLPAADERQLAERSSVVASLVLAPHHGSRHSSDPAFVAATEARTLIVQAGYRNRYGHPAPEVLARWRAAGVSVERNDESGSLIWHIDTRGARLSRWREVARRYWHDVPRSSDARSAEETESAPERGPEADVWGSPL